MKKQTRRVQQTRGNAIGKHPSEWYAMGESSESRHMKRKLARRGPAELAAHVAKARVKKKA